MFAEEFSSITNAAKAKPTQGLAINRLVPIMTNIARNTNAPMIPQ